MISQLGIKDFITNYKIFKLKNNTIYKIIKLKNNTIT